MHQQLWGYKVEEKLYLGVREQKKNVEYHWPTRFVTVAVCCKSCPLKWSDPVVCTGVAS